MASIPSKKKSTDGSWMKYMGLGAQFFGSIVIALVIGWKLDPLAGFGSPVLIWILPLLAVVFNLVKIIVETNKKDT
jgi:F0F1-type ATP synthase assembly protein I